MGRPFRRQSERRQIARPSYGGEREPDSHPTPGPPAFVQPARVLLPSSEGRAPRSSPGVVRSPGRSALSSRRSVGTDDSPGAWIAAALRHDRTVGSLVPPVFAAYARVLHPAVRYAGDDDVDVRWDEVAAYNGTTAHRLMQWPAVTGSWEHVAEEDQPGVWNDSPAEGHLPGPVAAALAGLLAGWTTTPQECWFGWCHDAPDRRPHLALPMCAVSLRRGPVTLASANFAPEPQEQSAAVWWPADRAWLVATDPTLMSTYVGGPVGAVDALLGSRLEVYPAAPDDPVGYDTDPVNPAPTRF
jgi:hypothetical protein